MVFVDHESLSTNFLIGNSFNICNTNPCLLANNFKDQLTIKLMSLSQVFYETPGENGGMSKCTLVVQLLQVTF